MMEIKQELKCGFEMNYRHFHWHYGSLLMIKESLEEKLISQFQENQRIKNLLADQNLYHKLYLTSTDLGKNESVAQNKQLFAEDFRIQKNFPIQKSKEKAIETKTVIRKFWRSIVHFIKKRGAFVQKILSETGIEFHVFLYALEEKKNSIRSIISLKNLWLDHEFAYAREARIISLYFLKRYGRQWIFNSGMNSRRSYLKYRQFLTELLEQGNFGEPKINKLLKL